MKRARSFAMAAALAAAGGCTPTTEPATDSGTTPVSDSGVDAARDCQALCVRSATSTCDCHMTCRGHEIAATCATGTCQCTSDGVATFSYASTACDPADFIPGCQGMAADAGSDAGASPSDGGHDAYTTLGAPTYTSEMRTITSGSVSRTFVLAMPDDIASRGALPLVFSLHGDGGNGPNMRTALPLEAHFAAATGAVFVYPTAPGGSFEYWTYDGRTAEAAFVSAVIAALHTELAIDTTHVFIAGFSGGATMANALGCRLGSTVVRGLGLHSGTLYSTDDASGDPEFTYTAGGGVSCSLPDALFVWGASDTTDGVSFMQGQGVRDNYVATASCDATTSAGPITPCVSYDGCTHEVAWCPIPGMGHAIWPNAAEAMGDFWSALP